LRAHGISTAYALRNSQKDQALSSSQKDQALSS
jgi:hypothetical protein